MNYSYWLMVIISLVMLHHIQCFSNKLKFNNNALYRKSAKLFSTSTVPVLENVKLLGASDLLAKTDIFIFDCDGVIWKGDSLIEGVPSVLDKLRELKKKIFFVTNNSTKSRKGYLSKFKSLGLNVNPEEIFSSSFAAAAYLEQNPLPAGKKAYIIGQEGIGQELDLLNIPHIGGPDDAGKVIKLGPGVRVDQDPDVGAVIVGFDSAINYYKIQYAQLCINENKDCRFIATNLDAVTHLTEEQEWAGNGAMVGAIKGCTGIEPILVGKPSPLMVDYIVNKYKCDRSRICMVGDRLDTDILFGSDNGLQTVLTLSGVTTKEKLLSESSLLRCASAFGSKTILIVGSPKYSTHGAHGAQKYVTIIHFYYWKDCIDYCKEKGCVHIYSISPKKLLELCINDDNNNEKFINSFSIDDYNFTTKNSVCFIVSEREDGLTTEQIVLSNKIFHVDIPCNDYANKISYETKLAICMQKFASSIRLTERSYENEKHILRDSNNCNMKFIKSGRIQANQTHVDAYNEEFVGLSNIFDNDEDD